MFVCFLFEMHTQNSWAGALFIQRINWSDWIDLASIGRTQDSLRFIWSIRRILMKWPGDTILVTSSAFLLHKYWMGYIVYFTTVLINRSL